MREQCGSRLGLERRRTAVREAIQVHNLAVEQPLRVLLAPGDGGVVCSEGGRRLQRHDLYLSIVAGGCGWSF